jgi:hypothetical protein
VSAIWKRRKRNGHYPDGNAEVDSTTSSDLPLPAAIDGIVPGIPVIRKIFSYPTMTFYLPGHDYLLTYLLTRSCNDRDYAEVYYAHRS